MAMVLLWVHILPGETKSGHSTPYLREYLRVASENNPSLKAAFHEWKAGLEQILQVRSLPDPDFNFAYFINEVETRVGAQKMRIGLAQKFPWFGKLKLKGEIAFERSQALKNRFEKQRTEVFYQVKKYYYDYYFVSKSIEIIHKNIQLLDSVNKQITSSYSTGTAPYSSMIRVQIELDKLSDRVRSLEDKLPAVRIALNSVLNRRKNQQVNIDANLQEIRFHLNGSGLTGQLKENSPELKKFHHLLMSSKANIKLSKKSFFPDISVGADYILTDDSIIPGFADSGKDPFLFKVGLNLPVRFKKIHSSIKEAELKMESVKYKKADKENKLISDLETALFHFNDSVRTVNLYQDSLIPKAKQAFEVLKTAFAAGQVDFIDFVDIQRTLLDFELQFEQSKTESYRSLALIEKIIGTGIENMNDGIQNKPGNES